MNPDGRPAGDALELFEEQNRMAILLTLTDKPGQLNKALNIITANNINMTSIQSRPPKLLHEKRYMDFNIDFFGSQEEPNVVKCMRELRQLSHSMTEIGTPEVPWFPTNIEDFD